MDPVSAAVNRFGLGAWPGERAEVGDPRAWLHAQVDRGADDAGAFAGLPTSLDYLRQAAAMQSARRDARKRGSRDSGASPAPDAGTDALREALAPLRRDERRDRLAEAAARLRVAAVTTTPFIERLVHFWSNHFAVSVDKTPARAFAAPLEREAIRPRVTGRFADLLVAVEMHPGMLLYLDNVRSTGTDSPLGLRVTRRLARQGGQDVGKAGGLNENLGREAMELHTVGVGGGYTQADVTEFARALTGWSVASARDFAAGREPGTAFVFREKAHEPGVRHVLGKAFAADGAEQGRDILEFLARMPATARQLSLKLARHFVSDNPPPALVERLAQSYLAHDTDLAAVYRTLIDSPEAWTPGAVKFRTPQDFFYAALRAARIDPGGNVRPLLALLTRMGQPMFEPRSPAGFPDAAADWIDADALWKRVQAAEALAARAAGAGVDPARFAGNILGPGLDEDTVQAMRRAESAREACATLLASPAFQWRT